MKSGCLPILKREIHGTLASPSFYLAAGAFFLMTGILLTVSLLQYITDSYAQANDPAYFSEPVNYTVDVVTRTFSAMAGLYLFVMPVLTMRTLAEERANGTLELLTTSPVSDWGIVLGKFFGAVAVNLLLLLGAAVYTGVMIWLGDTELPVLLSCLLGLLLVGLAFSAFGMFASSLTQSQGTAAIIGFVGLLAILMVRQLAPVSSSWFGQALNDLAFETHMEPFFRGILRLEDLIYMALFTVFFLVLTHTILRSRHWRA